MGVIGWLIVGLVSGALARLLVLRARPKVLGAVAASIAYRAAKSRRTA